PTSVAGLCALGEIQPRFPRCLGLYNGSSLLGLSISHTKIRHDHRPQVSPLFPHSQLTEAQAHVLAAHRRRGGRLRRASSASTSSLVSSPRSHSASATRTISPQSLLGFTGTLTAHDFVFA